MSPVQEPQLQACVIHVSLFYEAGTGTHIIGIDVGDAKPIKQQWEGRQKVAKRLGKVGTCLDARKVNHCTVKGAYPMPLIDGIFSRLPKAQYISCHNSSQVAQL